MNKTALQSQFKTLFNELRQFDGSNGKTQQDAINSISEEFATIIDNYIKTAIVRTTVTGTAGGYTIVGGVGSGSLS